MKKRVLVTGATRNIGLAISKKFHAEGYEVFGTYLSATEEVRAAFQLELPNSRLFHVDLCDSDSLSAFIKSISEYKFDAIVNNAGMLGLLDDGSIRHEFLDFSAQDFTNVVNCNLIATTRLSIELKDSINKGGAIIVIASGFHYLHERAVGSPGSGGAGAANQNRAGGNQAATDYA